MNSCRYQNWKGKSVNFECKIERTVKQTIAEWVNEFQTKCDVSYWTLHYMCTLYSIIFVNVLFVDIYAFLTKQTEH